VALNHITGGRQAKAIPYNVSDWFVNDFMFKFDFPVLLCFYIPTLQHGRQGLAHKNHYRKIQ